MAPLIVMCVAAVLVRAFAQSPRWADLPSWQGPLRIGLAAMFLFTAVSHFHPKTRVELIAMVPASLPAPSMLVTVTGILEALGAIGLLMPPPLRTAAAYGLILMLVAMFPANMRAAREGLTVAGRRATPLVWRLPLQAFWIVALWWVA